MRREWRSTLRGLDEMRFALVRREKVVRHPDASEASIRMTTLRVAVDATGEQWVRLLVVRHRQVHVDTIRRPFEEASAREDGVLGATVLANQPAQIVQTVTAAELPEGLLAEEQV